MTALLWYNVYMNTLSESQKGYIAGFIDGEGCISIYEFKRIRYLHKQYTAVVRVTNTNQEVLDTLRRWTGLGIICSQSIKRTNPKFFNSKPQYGWFLSPNATRELLPVIIPFLQVKRDIAKLVLEFYGDKPRPRGRGVTEAVLSKYALLASRARELNKRGL